MMNTPQKPQLNKHSVSGSALIAEFMGWIKSPYPNLPNKVYKENYTIGISLDQLNYRENWMLLMPVLEKICRKKIGDDITYVKYATPRTFGMLNEDNGQIMVRLDGFQLFQADTLIEATYLSIVDYLQCLSQADR